MCLSRTEQGFLLKMKHCNRLVPDLGLSSISIRIKNYSKLGFSSIEEKNTKNQAIPKQTRPFPPTEKSQEFSSVINWVSPDWPKCSLGENYKTKIQRQSAKADIYLHIYVDCIGEGRRGLRMVAATVTSVCTFKRSQRGTIGQITIPRSCRQATYTQLVNG